MSKSRVFPFIFCLQYFADGGASGGDGGEGAGAAAGENAADAGRDNLETLGVPREYAERHRQRMEKRKGKQPTAQAPAAAPAQAGAQAAEEAPKGVSWDEFFSDQGNKDRLQQMMAERGKSATEAKQAANAQLERRPQLLKLLGEKYGIKPGEDGSFDLDAINKAVTDDDSYFENKALEMGVSVDVARKLEQADALEQQRQEAEQKARRDAMLREHFANVQAQARALQEIVPGFSLEKEMQDPEFVRRTAPGGLSVEDAFFSLHHKEIMQQQAEAIARRSKQAAAAAVQSGSARPRENGSSATAAVTATPNMRSMSRADRLAYIKSKYPPRT